MMRLRLTIAYLLQRAVGRAPAEGASASFWQPVPAQGGSQRYFREDDPAEPPPGLAVRWLLRLSRPFAPRAVNGPKILGQQESDAIPDEIYTLW